LAIGDQLKLHCPEQRVWLPDGQSHLI
jgi:hypothetical protein